MLPPQQPFNSCAPGCRVETLLVTVHMVVTPLSDCVLPPFTSKVTRTAYAALTGSPPSPPEKRSASFSLLFRGGKPLYRELEPRGRGKPAAVELTARAGERLECRCSLLSRSPPPLPQPSARFRFGAAEMVTEVTRVEVARASEVSLDVPDKFVVRFLTPTLVPVPNRGRLLRERGVRRRYKLLPDLPLALALLAYDLKLRGLLDVEPRRVRRWAELALAEVDYRVRPVTALYTFREGKPAVERGFVGYVSYELLDPSIREVLSRLLGFAQRLGLGKSRSIGFGHIEVVPLE